MANKHLTYATAYNSAIVSISDLGGFPQSLRGLLLVMSWHLSGLKWPVCVKRPHLLEGAQFMLDCHLRA